MRTKGPWSVALLALASAGVFVVLALGYESWPVADIDEAVSEWVVANAPAWLEWLARVFSWLGGWIGLTVVGAVVFAVLARERHLAALWFFALAFVGSQLAANLLKLVFDRERPTTGSPVDVPDSAAFPSGHAAAGTACVGAVAVLVAERRWPAARAPRSFWLVAGLLGFAIGASRVILNVHWVSDVVAGWAFGLAWLAACLLVLRR